MLFFYLHSCTGVGHRVGAYSRGVGRDLSVGTWSCQFAATDRTEPGSTLGKVNNNSERTVSVYIDFYFIKRLRVKITLHKVLPS